MKNIRNEIRKWNDWFKKQEEENQDVYIISPDLYVFKAIKKGNSIYLTCIDNDTDSELTGFSIFQLIESNYKILAPDKF